MISRNHPVFLDFSLSILIFTLSIMNKLIELFRGYNLPDTEIILPFSGPRGLKTFVPKEFLELTFRISR
jgi:hypothetical protein